jgi:hypothetical protein
LAYFLRFDYLRQQNDHRQIRLNIARCLRMFKSSNAHQNRQIRYESYQKLLRKFIRVSSIRIIVSRSQNFLDKSATTSRFGGMMKASGSGQALLVVADLFIVKFIFQPVLFSLADHSQLHEKISNARFPQLSLVFFNR